MITKVSNGHSWTCMDLYIFATPYRVKWAYYFLSRELKVEFDEWEGKAEYEYVSYYHMAITPLFAYGTLTTNYGSENLDMKMKSLHIMIGLSLTSQPHSLALNNRSIKLYMISQKSVLQTNEL